jgi:hypothetical protein
MLVTELNKTDLVKEPRNEYIILSVDGILR